MIVLLDTGPLGMLTNPNANDATLACNEWLETLLQKGVRVYVPEIADYELRRELLRANLTAAVQRLDALKVVLIYLPLTTATMLKAAEFWAQMRQQHRPTADDKALDGDVILAAQSALLSQVGDNVVIATTNVGHLSRMVPASVWQSIT